VIAGDVLRDSVAAVSAGIVDGQPLLDLDYPEDSRAEVDFNVVMTGSGNLVEVQGTAEGEPFTRQQLDAMVSLASKGIEQLTAIQREASGA
jgi:ribonuclease PH